MLRKIIHIVTTGRYRHVRSFPLPSRYPFFCRMFKLLNFKLLFHKLFPFENEGKIYIILLHILVDIV